MASRFRVRGSRFRVPGLEFRGFIVEGLLLRLRAFRVEDIMQRLANLKQRSLVMP